MANTSIPVSRVSVGEVRLGRIFDRTTSIYTRNLVPFSLVALVASIPPLLLVAGVGIGAANPVVGMSPGAMVLIWLLSVSLGLLSQAILVYGAFQDMRGRPVNLSESVNVGLARLVPIIGLTFLTVFGIAIGFMLLLVPGLMLLTRWFVAVPVCMVERVGPVDSLRRSSQLTAGHRWKVFGTILLLYIGAGIVSQIITVTMAAIGGSMLALLGSLIWNTIWGAFFATFVVVTYYELRSAKEGIDIEQIAAVFD
jgi:hypothetical protein